MPDEKACQSFNARIMKHIMKQKMGKNETFYTSKVANVAGGDKNHPNSHFLKAARPSQVVTKNNMDS